MKRIIKAFRNMRINTRLTLSCIVGIFIATLTTGLVELFVEINFPEFQDKIIEKISHPAFTWTLIAIGLVFSVILVSFITSKTIVKPINMLCDGVKEIGSGNLDYKINYNGKNELGITATAFNEMTERLKQLESERYLIEKSRKELIAGVAHDLRTPLTTIKGYTEGLRDGIANTPKMQEDYLQTIYTASLDLDRLLNELLTISQLETSEIFINPQPCNVYEFLTELIEEAQYPVQKRGASLILNTNELNKNDVLMIDTDRFLRVISNLFGNSFKYASKARKLVITITAKSFDDYVSLTFSDNGIGISEENLPHIFDTFFRADQARTRVSEGSGLGLAICKEIISLHHGKIWASSVEGEGTSIIISLRKNSKEESL